LYKEKLLDEVITWHDRDEESTCIPILENKRRLGKLNTFYLSGLPFFFLPCLRMIDKLIESCIYFGTRLYGDLHSTTSSKFVPCLHRSSSHPTCQDWGKLMHNLPSRSVVPTLGFWNPSATQLQNCWNTGFEHVGELDMSPLASMMASDFISWELLA
jgi:hypothetical protein